MKILIIGGHLTPALSVIEALSKKDEIIYVGRRYALEGDKAISLEYNTIREKGIKFEELKSGRFQRSFTKHTIPSLLRIPNGFYGSFKLLKKYKPDVVVGFGGYLSFPIIVTANLLKIPSVIHEQTLEAGEANLRLGRFAKKICISFDSSREFFPKEKIVLTGNPVRKSITNPKKKFKITSRDPILYITGGSLGSHFLNELVGEVLAKLLDKFIVIHQTGAAEEFNDFSKLSILKEGLNNGKRDRYFLSKFYSTDEVGSILRQASLVVSRAGVNSVTELATLKKPALLIPLPVSQKDEQKKNAMYLNELGLAEILNQENLNAEEFLFRINKMMLNIEDYKLNEELVNFQSGAAINIVKVIYDFQKNSN